MTRYRTDRGEINIKTLFSLAALLMTAYLCFKFVPVYVAAYDFDSTMQTQAQYAGSLKPNETILRELLAKAGELDLPITKENITIERSSSRIVITADYIVPVRTVFFTYNWRFTEEESAVLF